MARGRGKMQSPTSCSFRGIVVHDCGGGESLLCLWKVTGKHPLDVPKILSTWFGMSKLPIPDGKVYRIMVAHCCTQICANRQVLKFF